MSDTAALALLIAIFFVGATTYLHAVKLAHDVASEIVTGTARAVVLPVRWRWQLLYGRYVYLCLTIVVWSLVLAAVNVKIANLAGDPGVTTIAYAFAALGVFGALSWSMHAILELMHLRGILRQAEAD